MGELPRGGFYSDVTVERMLGMKVANSDRSLPEFRDPKVGEAIDRAGRKVIQAVEPNRHLVLGPTARPDLKVTWALALRHAGERSTRLVSRCRVGMKPGWARILSRTVLEAGQLLMERKMLVEIRRRVASRAGASSGDLPSSRAPTLPSAKR